MSDSHSCLSPLPRCCRTLIFAALVCVLACSTPPRTGPAFTPAPPPEPDEARIYAYREDSSPGPPEVELNLDGESIGTLANGEYLTFTVPGGRHSIAARTRIAGLWPLGWKKIAFDARAGDTLFLKVYLQLTAPPVDPAIGPDFGAPGRSSRNETANVFLAWRSEDEAMPGLRGTTRRVDAEPVARSTRPQRVERGAQVVS